MGLCVSVWSVIFDLMFNAQANRYRINLGIKMKTSDNLKQLINDISKYPDGLKVKVNTSALRELVQNDALHRAGVTASITMLAWFADNTPISFAERERILSIISAMSGDEPLTADQATQRVNELMQIAGHYTPE